MKHAPQPQDATLTVTETALREFAQIDRFFLDTMPAIDMKDLIYCIVFLRGVQRPWDSYTFSNTGPNPCSFSLLEMNERSSVVLFAAGLGIPAALAHRRKKPLQ